MDDCTKNNRSQSLTREGNQETPLTAPFASAKCNQLAIGCGAVDAGGASTTDFLDFFLKRLNPFMMMEQEQLLSGMANEKQHYSLNPGS